VPRILYTLAFLGTFTLVGGALAAGPETVSFRAATYPWSALRINLAKSRGETLPPRQGDELAGLLYKPISYGKAPAVVLLHGCRGIRSYQRDWARRVATWGYMVLLVDSFSTRGTTDTCPHILDWEARPEVGGIALDALGGLFYLAERADVDPDRIAVMGWAFDGVINAVMKEGHPKYYKRGFAAAVAFYPNCAYTARSQFTVPLLALVGGEDDWTPPDNCVRMAGPATPGSSSVQVKLYPGAFHGFDDPDSGQKTWLRDVWNPTRQPTRGGTVAYEREAHDDAIKRVQAFLGKHLRLGTLASASPYSPGGPGGWNDPRANVEPWVDGEPGTWAVDPADPGPSRPPAGRSLFDHLFGTVENGKPRWDIPFPFDRLIARLAPLVAPDPRGMAAVKQVLVPLGRSLQREAAAPDFFRHPRVVAGFDTEPADGDVGMLLKDRLYIGYQETARALEVISWNEAAGRFEFQVVHDYDAGATPRVTYANRAICTACHQNQAPIFPRASWLETNSNFLMAERLAAENRDFWGIPLQNRPNLSFALDTSADRANLLPVLQTLWSEGCGTADDGEPLAGTRCRAAAFAAMVQYRLTGSFAFDRLKPAYATDYAQTLSDNWEDKWPGGLMVPDADIADRDPMTGGLAITPEIDPLTKRPPLAIWSARSPRDLDRLIVDLASTLMAADVKALSDALLARAVKTAAARTTYDGMCPVEADPARGARFKWRFRCRLDDERSDREAIVEGGLTAAANGRMSGEISLMRLDGAIVYSGIALVDGIVTDTGAGQAVRLVPVESRSGLRVMLPDGRMAAGLDLQLPDEARVERTTAGADAGFAGPGHLVTIAAFDPVTDAIGRWVDAAAGGEAAPPLDPGPFHGPRAMAALFRDLGLPARDRCCTDTAALPGIEVDETTAVPALAVADDSGLVGAFTRNCATCHRTDSTFPPNFLAGDRGRIEANLASCAPRIAYRLAMWAVDPSARARTPMPPAQAVARHDLTPETWQESADYHALRTYVDSLLAVQGRKADEVRAADYDSLPGCLAAG
jgi:dienelactone hydrolase/mono/diheme cytochrome c family protein